MPNTAKRLDIVKADSACVGSFVRALEKSVALTDGVQRPINEIYVKHAMAGPLLSKLFAW
jgi:hypothetical protein